MYHDLKPGLPLLSLIGPRTVRTVFSIELAREEGCFWCRFAKGWVITIFNYEGSAYGHWDDPRTIQCTALSER